MRIRIVAVALGLLAPAGATGRAAPAEPTPPIESANAVCGGLWLSGGELHEASTGALVWSESSDTVIALACQTGGEPMAAVGATRGTRGDGRVVLLRPGVAPGSPWAVMGEIETRGVPRRLALESGRLAAVVEGRRDASFGIVDAALGARLQTVKMPEKPVAVGVSPDGESFVLAIGNDLRTFRVDDGRTRAIYPFPERIVALAAQRGAPRVLVGQGNRLVAVDPRDKPERGALPIRAQADLLGPAMSLVWMGEGRAAGVLIAEPAALLVLGGNDLAVLERREQEADAIGSRGVSELFWVRGGKEKTTGVVRLAEAPPELTPYEPAPSPPGASHEGGETVSPPPGPQTVMPPAKAQPPAAGTEPPKAAPPPVLPVVPPATKAEPPSQPPAK